MNKSVLHKVREMVEPSITQLGLELVDVEYVKEGAHWYLRIFIDKETGIDIDDCTTVSHLASDILDKGDLIFQAYMLEVSSPGIERPLRKREDYEKYRGELISLYTSEPLNGYTRFTGYLKGLIEEKVILEYEKQEISIPYSIVEKAHITFEF